MCVILHSATSCGSLHVLICCHPQKKGKKQNSNTKRAQLDVKVRHTISPQLEGCGGDDVRNTDTEFYSCTMDCTNSQVSPMATVAEKL